MMQGNNHKCSYALKIQDIGVLMIFISYGKRYHTRNESNITPSVVFVTKNTSENVILYTVQ